MKCGFHMDRKSLKRIVNALVEEQKVRAMKVTIKVDTKEKTVRLLGGAALLIGFLEVFSIVSDFLFMEYMSHIMRKPMFWFPTWSNANQAVQLQKMAETLKFWI